MPVPSVTEIVDVIIDLLAQDAHRDPVELRRELEALGEQLPVDSVLAVEVLARIEDRYGVTLPATVEASRNLRSVRRFADAVHDLAVERDTRTGVSA